MTEKRPALALLLSAIVFGGELPAFRYNKPAPKPKKKLNSTLGDYRFDGRAPTRRRRQVLNRQLG